MSAESMRDTKISYTVPTPLVSDDKDQWSGQQKGQEIGTHIWNQKKKKKSQWDKYILEKEHTRLYLSLTILYFSVFS